MKLKVVQNSCVKFYPAGNDSQSNLFISSSAEGSTTINYRQIWHPDYSMSSIVPNIVRGVSEQNSIVNKCLQMTRQPKGRSLLVMSISISKYGRDFLIYA